MRTEGQVARMIRSGAVLMMVVVTASCDPGDGSPVEVAESAPTTSPSSAHARTPRGTVRIPGGRLVDPGCISEVPNGATIDDQGNVSVGGTIVARHKPCTSAQMNVEAPSGGAEKVLLPTPLDNTWVENTDATAQTLNGYAQFNFLNAHFKVPQPPPEYEFQVIYLFPSFKDATGKQQIIQPVLMYGYNNEFGGNFWTMTSWYVGPDHAYHTPPWTVPAGHTILGQIRIISPGNWGCGTTDTNTGINTSLQVNVAFPFKTAQSGVLEVYSLDNCNQLPATDAVFTDVQISQAGPTATSVNWVHPSFTNKFASGFNPQCGYSIGARTYTDGSGIPAIDTTLRY